MTSRKTNEFVSRDVMKEQQRQGNGSKKEAIGTAEGGAMDQKQVKQDQERKTKTGSKPKSRAREGAVKR